jgi:hypothetical protein
MAQALQFLHHRFDTAGTDQQDAVSQSADDVRGQLFTRQEFLGEHGIFRLNETDTAVQLDGDA